MKDQECPCPECKGAGYKFVVCYALGVITCPKCGNPDDLFIWSRVDDKTRVFLIPIESRNFTTQQCLDAIKRKDWLPLPIPNKGIE